MTLQLRLHKIATLIMVSFLMVNTTAQALDALPCSAELGFVPFSTTPKNYPESKGSGIAVSFYAAPFSNWRQGIELAGHSQGSGNFVSLEYRYYVSGFSQFTSPTRGMETSFKHTGWFFQGGGAGYELIQTDLVSLNTYRVTGLGLSVGTGWELPVWGKIFLSPRVGYISSVAGSASFDGFNARIMVGIPITFY